MHKSLYLKGLTGRIVVQINRLMLLVFLVCVTAELKAQAAILSWNLKDFGASKTEAEITLIADIMRSYDIIAIQEVVAGPGGPQAFARLANQLNRKGFKWNYELSDPTSGSSAHKSERYAFLWKDAKATIIGRGWLEKKYGDLIEREPFYARFSYNKGKKITLVNFHAITKSRQPETEIKYFRYLPLEYSNDKLLFCGDFNLPQQHSVFNPIKKMGYQPALVSQKTSLRQRCIQNDCLASEFDNFFFNGTFIRFLSAGIVPFYQNFENLKDARKISDHVPIFIHVN